MGRLIAAAAVILVVQIGLVVAMNMRESGYTPYSPTELVAPVDPAEIDAFSITARDEGEIHLRQVDGEWFIEGQGGLTVPAADEQVKSFLEKITSFKRGLAVATSKEAADRFDVQSDSPAYFVQIDVDGQTRSKLYFGTSPGFRQIHVRTEGTNEIVIVGLGSHELSPDVEQWIDKDLVKFDTDQLKTMVIDDLTLIRQDDGWRVEGAAGYVETDGGTEDDKIDRLVQLASDLSIHGFLGKTLSEEAVGEDGIAMETVLNDDSVLQWSIVRHDENNHILSRSDLDYALLISSWQIDDIKKIIGEIQSGETAGSTDRSLPEAVEGEKRTNQVTE